MSRMMVEEEKDELVGGRVEKKNLILLYCTQQTHKVNEERGWNSSLTM